jgi:predicted RNase H-like nuclease (RuvC/YqgF family)
VDFDAGNGGEIHAEDPIELGAEVKTEGIAAAPGSGRQRILVGIDPGAEVAEELVEFFITLLDLGLVVAIRAQREFTGVADGLP